jgi:hypothetical protein
MDFWGESMACTWAWIVIPGCNEAFIRDLNSSDYLPCCYMSYLCFTPINQAGYSPGPGLSNRSSSLRNPGAGLSDVSLGAHKRLFCDNDTLRFS